MKNKVFSIIRDALLITLIVYTFIVSWNTGGLLAFFSIIALGIVLGLLTLIYDVETLDRDKQLGIHIGGSLLAILLVALINSWLIIDWSKVFTAILILAILAVLAYAGYLYWQKKDKLPRQDKHHHVEMDHDLDEAYDHNRSTVEHVDRKVASDRSKVDTHAAMNPTQGESDEYSYFNENKGDKHSHNSHTSTVTAQDEAVDDEFVAVDTHTVNSYRDEDMLEETDELEELDALEELEELEELDELDSLPTHDGYASTESLDVIDEANEDIDRAYAKDIQDHTTESDRADAVVTPVIMTPEAEEKATTDVHTVHDSAEDMDRADEPVDTFMENEDPISADTTHHSKERSYYTFPEIDVLTKHS